MEFGDFIFFWATGSNGCLVCIQIQDLIDKKKPGTLIKMFQLAHTIEDQHEEVPVPLLTFKERQYWQPTTYLSSMQRQEPLSIDAIESDPIQIESKYQHSEDQPGNHYHAQDQDDHNWNDDQYQSDSQQIDLSDPIQQKLEKTRRQVMSLPIPFHHDPNVSQFLSRLATHVSKAHKYWLDKHMTEDTYLEKRTETIMDYDSETW
jgi:hypothetical protein